MLAWGGSPTPYKPAWRAAACPSRRSEPAARLRHLCRLFNGLIATRIAMDVAWRILLFWRSPTAATAGGPVRGRKADLEAAPDFRGSLARSAETMLAPGTMFFWTVLHTRTGPGSAMVDAFRYTPPTATMSRPLETPAQAGHRIGWTFTILSAGPAPPEQVTTHVPAAAISPPTPSVVLQALAAWYTTFAFDDRANPGCPYPSLGRLPSYLCALSLDGGSVRSPWRSAS